MVPRLLERMGVECIKLYWEPNGEFNNNIESLAEKITEIYKIVVEENACIL